MHRIILYVTTALLALLIHAPSTYAAAEPHEQLTHITPTTLDATVVYPSNHAIIAPQPLHILAWDNITLPEELVREDVVMQIWDQDNHVIQQFGSKVLDSPKVDISMIDSTLYPSIRIVLFDARNHFTLDTLYPAVFTYTDTFNTRLVIFIIFFCALIGAVLVQLTRSHISFTYLAKNILSPLRETTSSTSIAHSIFISLVSLSIFALALGSYTSTTHILYLAIKLPVLLYGSLCISMLSVVVLLTLLGDNTHTFRWLIATFAKSLLSVSLLLASFAPLVLFYIYYPFSHDALLGMMMALFAIAAFGGMISMYASLRRNTQSRFKAQLAIVIWLIIYGSVLMQLGWMLRPWVGVPDPVFHIVPFARPYSGNVFIEIIHTLKRL